MKTAPYFVLLAFGLCACSGDDGAGSGGGDASGSGVVEVSGGTIYHSINRLATELSGDIPDYSGLAVELFALESLQTNANPRALASTPLPSGCSTTRSCDWTLGEVNLGTVKEGLVARLADPRSEPIWVSTFTRFLDATELAAAKNAGQTDAGRAFAVSREAVRVVLEPIAGLDAEELLARGFIFGLVYDPSGAPISGATVEPGNPDLTIVYPNDRFTGVEAETTMQGAFLAIAFEADAAPTTLTVTAPSSGLTWDPSELGLTVPGSIYFALLVANR